MGTFALRFFIAFYFEGTGDSGGWRLAGKTGLHGEQLGMGKGKVYDGDCPLLCANWPPLTYHYYIAMRWLYENLNPFHFPAWGYNKLLPVLSGVAVVYLIYKYALLFRLKRPFLLASLYAFHPLSLYISAYHGQRESSWLFFLLLSVILYKLKKYFWLACAFAIGVSIKIPPLLFFPFFFLKIPARKDKVIFAILVPSIFFILSLPEIVTYTNNVINQVFLYSGWKGWWGMSGIATKADILIGYPVVSTIFAPINRIFLYLGILASYFYFYKKRIDIIEAILGIIMVVFVFSPTFASQYILWPLPFMVLLYKKYKKYFWLYTIFGLFAAINTYGIFRIRFLENIFLNGPQNFLYYKIPFFAYPMDLYFPLWIVCFLFLIRLMRGKEIARR